MIGATRLFYINAGDRFQGFLKESTIRDYDRFLRRFELFKFRTDDKILIQSFMRECKKNSTRVELANRIDSILEGDCTLDCADVEEYYKVLGNEISKIRNEPNKSYMFCIHNKLKVVLTVQQAIRLYYDLKSFYENYLILEDLFKFSIRSENKVEVLTKQEKITDKKRIPPPPPNTQPLNILDSIVSFCLTKVIRTSLIHQSITYFQYVTKDSCYLENKEDKIVINLPNIVPSSSIYNTNFFRSLILSLSTINIQQVKHYITKLVNILNSNEKDYTESPVHIMMISYLIFLYFLRCTYDSHTQYIIDNIDNILNETFLQTKVINHNLGIYAKTSNIIFKVVDTDIFEKGIDTSEIGKEYSHLIAVDEEKFIETVLKETKQNVPQDFLLSSKKVLDLRLLKTVNKFKNVNKLFDIDGQILDQDLNGLLNYTNTEEDFTDAYRLFKKYNDNPSVLMLRESKVPKTVLNLFESLKKILNRQNFGEVDVSTLGYYIKLCNLLPNVKMLSHITILYIIFQIIIPFHYEIYGTTSFIDQLLF